MTVINTNIAAIAANNALKTNSRQLEDAMRHLATGKRINSAADDAAGLSISMNIEAQTRGLDQAIRNANDGIGLLQTAEGALIEVGAMLQRMRELAVQALSETTTSAQKGFLNDEYQLLEAEIQRITTDTEWNEVAILNGSHVGVGGTGGAGSFSFQIGANGTQTMEVVIRDMTVNSGLAVNLGALALNDITSVTNATAALTDLDTAIGALADQRSEIGAGINRLGHAIESLSIVSQEAKASKSQIEDTDYASATTELARTQIIQQAATAMLAQANQSPATVLALLQ